MLERLPLLALLPLALATPAAAQWSITSHLASDGSLHGDPFVAGASLTSVNNHVGMRIGFNVDASETPVSGLTPPNQRSSHAGLTVDFDGMYYPVRPPDGAGIAPYAFLSLGARESESDHKLLTGSYGSGVDLQLSRHFGIQAETRRRIPLNAAPEDVFANGWEFRFGVSLRLSGGRRPTPTPREVRPAPVRETYFPPRPEPVVPVRRAVHEEAPSARLALATRAIATAESYLGVPYKWGGTSPSRGFDCSGLVQYVYRAHGITLPRVSRQQATAGIDLPTRIDALEPGDLMFFASRGSRIDHVAIYAGDGRILHASKGRGEVGYDNLWSSRGAWFREHFVAARRVISEDEIVF